MSDRPEVCVSALVHRADHVLMIRRAQAPGKGRWSLPGGHVEMGELLIEAVVREVAEETGLVCVAGPLLTTIELFSDGRHFVILVFEATVLDPRQPHPGSDAAEAAWVRCGDISDLDLTEGLLEVLAEAGVVPVLW